MTIVYPINGRNERMGSLFKTPKHLLLCDGKEILVRSIETMNNVFNNTQIIILTNREYYTDVLAAVENTHNIAVRLIDKTQSQVETLKKATCDLKGPVMFVDCDIVPVNLTKFNDRFPTVFTFNNTTGLLNYSNFKANKYKTVTDCNEKQRLYKNAGAGIYYFPSAESFNEYSENTRSVSECISKMLQDKVKVKINSDSKIDRYGTLQDIYIDSFSFRESRAKDLSTGFTNNRVCREGQTVVKTGKTTLAEYEWYSVYKNKKHIPNIISYNKDTITMEYIKRNADINLDDVLETIYTYRLYDPLNNLPFNAYIQNITNHLADNAKISNGQTLLDRLHLNISPTFCHGDLSVMNIIPTRLGLKLIDPLYSKSKFGSYELDIAKLCFSFKFYKNDSASANYVQSIANIPDLDVLIAAESVRVASYKKEYSFVAENLINELVHK